MGSPGIGVAGAKSDLKYSPDKLGGRLEAFVAKDDRTLNHIWQTAPNNGWSDWAL